MKRVTAHSSGMAFFSRLAPPPYSLPDIEAMYSIDEETRVRETCFLIANT